MPFDIDVFVSYSHLDDVSLSEGRGAWVATFLRALELRLSQLLGRRAVVYADTKLKGNDILADQITDRIRRSATFVSIVSPRYVASEWARRELDEFVRAAANTGAPARGRLFTVVKSPVSREHQAAELHESLAYEFFSVDPKTGTTREFDRIFGPEADRSFWLKLDDLAHDLASQLQPLATDAAAELPGSRWVPQARPWRSRTPSASRDWQERILLGVSAPNASRPGEAFIARFVAYVEELSDLVAQQLLGLDAHGDSRAVLGLSPARARWRIGAPVTVRVGGSHFQARPSSQTFEWSGRHNLLSFVVEVDATAPAGQIALCFEAFIEGVSVAFIPMTMAIGKDQPPGGLETKSEPVALTAFASYASRDASSVAACLSALKHWDPALDVFMDCLDLTPNDEWQRELERVIPTKDAFLLFWSVNARQSRWVAWELQHAKATKGLGWIRPMPLDDPAVAPPPDDLKHLHFSDRYLIARQAFLQRQTEAVPCPRVYFIYDQRDAPAIAPWAEELDAVFEIIHPVFEGTEREIRDGHEERLRTCDAALFFYGTEREAWVRRKLRDLQKAAGYGRARPAPLVGICLIAPKTPEKERFRTHAAIVIPQWDGVSGAHLQPFVDQVLERAAEGA
jgi:hypothetical protein